MDEVQPGSGDLAYFNGVDASTGGHVTPPMTARQVAKLAAGERLDPDERDELLRQWTRMKEPHFAPIAGVDCQDLSQAGWGVVFAPDIGDDVKEALKPLLQLRQGQARNYYHDFPGDRAFRLRDTKMSFLARSKAAHGPVNPLKAPYYLLLVGSPEAIPFKFQYQLDVQHAVGRIHFDTADEYASYANTVVAAEGGKVSRPRKVGLFGVKNRDDEATRLAADHLIAPLARSLQQSHPQWATQPLIGPECTRAAFLNLLKENDAPALLLTTSHGIALPNCDPCQLRHQGALLCQDWPGPHQHQGPIPENYFVAAEHIGSDTRFAGLVAFFFACYGGGTPMTDDLAHLEQRPHAHVAPRPFVAALPKALLGRRDGALAVIAPVDRVWSCSFLSAHGRQTGVFESTLVSLLNGQRIGAAMEYFNARYAELSSDLVAERDDRAARRPRPEAETLAEDRELAGLWTTHNDARSYVLLGDPAVKLAVAEASI